MTVVWEHIEVIVVGASLYLVRISCKVLAVEQHFLVIESWRKN